MMDRKRTYKVNAAKLQRKIVSLIEQLGSNGFFCTGGVDRQKIRQLEKTLKVQLPNSFKWFLGKYGYVLVLGNEIFGYGLSGWNLLEEQARYEQMGLPEGYVVIMDDVDDYAWFLETRRMKDGECPVVLWHPEDPIDESYPNFYEFLLQRILDEESLANWYD